MSGFAWYGGGAAAAESAAAPSYAELAGQSDGATTPVGNLTGVASLSGVATGAGVAAGSLTGVTSLTGTAAGQGDPTGALTGTAALSGSSVGAGVAAGALGGTAALQGETSGETGATADLSIVGVAELSGVASGVATAAGDLLAPPPVTFASVSSSIVVGASPTSRITLGEPITETQLQITRGDDVPISLAFGQPLSSLAEIWFTVRAAWSAAESNDADAVYSATLTGGAITGSGSSASLELPHSATAEWLDDEYVFDVQVRTLSDQILTPVRGQLLVAPDVTRSQ